MSKQQTQQTCSSEKTQYEDRWSAYGANTGILRFSGALSMQELKRFELFHPFDNSVLSKLAPDISVARWRAGAVLFEEGCYLDLAFYIIEGQVDLHFSRKQHSEPIFDSVRLPAPGFYTPDSVRHAGLGEHTIIQHPVAKPQRQNQETSFAEIPFLSTMFREPPSGESMQLGRNDFFGEIGAMNGWPQSVTAQTVTDCTLMQIRLPALREIKQQSPDLKNRLDALYRKRTLSAQLKTTPLFFDVADAFLDTLTQEVDLISCPPDTIVFSEGNIADSLFLVSSGFVKLTQRVGAGEMTVSYLSKGMTAGETELLIDELVTWQHTGISTGYTELIQIRRDTIRSLLNAYPDIERQLWSSVVERIKESGRARRNIDISDLIEFSLSEGLVQGNSMLVIDLDVCTRCDDCVRGCAATHGRRPRFVREGEKYHNFLITRSCYHCEDPVCLIGCPTGAIQRANVIDVVDVDDNLCIGCDNCVQKCPYAAIVLHDTGERWPESGVSEQLQGQMRLVASKCDLCFESSHGPACVNNCPHSCAFRIASLDDFRQLLGVNALHH